MVKMPHKFMQERLPDMWQARVTLFERSPASSASIKEPRKKAMAKLKAAVFSGSKKSLGIKCPDVFSKYCTRKRKEVENKNELLQLSKKRKNLSIV